MTIDKLRKAIQTLRGAAQKSADSHQQSTAEAESLASILARAEDIESSIQAGGDLYRSKLAMFDLLTSDKRFIAAMDRFFRNTSGGVDIAYPALERLVCIAGARSIRDRVEEALRDRHIKAPEEAMRAFHAEHASLLDDQGDRPKPK